MFSMTITKATGAGFGQDRNYYRFFTSSAKNGVGTVRVDGMGFVSTASLSSISLTCSGGTLTGFWNTVHYY